MRLDVFTAVKTYAESVNPGLEGLDAEAARYVTRTMRDYKRRGLHLPEEARNKVCVHDSLHIVCLLSAGV